jgi:hypothetical protein
MRAFVAAVLVLAAWPSAARAQASPSAPLAEKLFIEGKDLMRAGDPASLQQACDKLAASQRLDPGVGTLVVLALCHEKQGKTATAWSEFTEAAAQAAHAGEADRERYAREHVAGLEARLHKVVLEMTPPAGGAELMLDGQPLPGGTIGAEIPLDPGTHSIEMTAPGKRKWARQVEIAADAGVTRVPVQLEDAEGPAAQTVAPPERVERPLPSAGGTARTVGFVALGAGAVALATGVIFELRAQSLKSNSDNEAHQAAGAQLAGDQASHDSLKQQADGDYASAQTSQTVAIVAGGVAAVAVAAGVTALLMSSSSSHPTSGVQVRPDVGRSVAGITLVATW